MVCTQGHIRQSSAESTAPPESATVTDVPDSLTTVEDHVAVVYPVNTPENVAPVFVPTPFSNFDGDLAAAVSQEQSSEEIIEDVEIVRPTYSSVLTTVRLDSLQRLAQLNERANNELLSSSNNVAENLITSQRVSSSAHNGGGSPSATATASIGGSAKVLTSKPAHISPVYKPDSSSKLLLHSSSPSISSKLNLLKGKRESLLNVMKKNILKETLLLSFFLTKLLYKS